MDSLLFVWVAVASVSIRLADGYHQYYPKPRNEEYGGGPTSNMVYSMLDSVVGSLNSDDQFDLGHGRGAAADAYLNEAINQIDDALTQQNKDYENGQRFLSDYDIQDTMTRDQEYLQHSSLWGHQYVAGGAGEGKQRLKPDGSIKNVQEVKTDNMLPAYCSPPNPCPRGYTVEDGCLEEFVNSAAFSREYQAAQECMCDTEHMFDCPSTTRENEINALAQSIQNEGAMDHALNKIMEDLQLQVHDQHKNMVAKKHQTVQEQERQQYVQKLHEMAQQSTLAEKAEKNPYLQGEKLPIVAKKTPTV